ncbi:hypothetical protein ACVFYP_13790 [Roseomonas sp. F4]
MTARLALLLVMLATPALAQPQPPACLFPRGSDVLEEDCLALLAELATAPGRFELRGYAQDQQGPRLDGLLSRRRVEAVAEELRRLGVAPDRLTVRTPPAEARDMRGTVDPFRRRVEIERRD